MTSNHLAELYRRPQERGWPYSHVLEDLPLVEVMYLVFTRMLGGCYRRRFESDDVYM